MRLRNWIAVVVSVLLLVAVGIVGVLVNRSALRAADTVHRADTQALAVNNATLAGQMQLLSAKDLAAFADSYPFNLGAGVASDRDALKEYVRKSSLFSYGAAITTLTGAVLNATTTNALPVASDPGYAAMRKLLLAGQAGFSPVMLVPSSDNKPIAVQAVAVPIKVSGAATAVLIGFSELARTTLQAYTAKLKSSAHVTLIIDSAGVVGYSSEAGTIGTAVDASIIAAIKANPDGPSFAEYSSGGADQIASVVTGDVLPGGWAYVRTQTMASFDGAVHSRSQTINITLLAMLLIGAVGISILGYRTQIQRRRADEKFQALFQHAPDMVAVLDAEGRVEYASPSAASVLHFPAGSKQGSSVFDLVHPDDRQNMMGAFASLMQQRDGVLRLQTRILNASGTATWFEFTASNQMYNPALNGIVINARDVSENRAFQERLTYEAQHDALTGLPNRRRLQDALDSSLRSDSVAVLFVDLDGFKPVNDAYGHEAGDELLRQVADRLSACVREEDVLARVGGDEFVVLMPGIVAGPDAETMSNRVRAEVEHPFLVLGHEVRITASVGVHLADPSDDPDQALRAADHAMYTEKRQTGGRTSGVAPMLPAVPQPEPHVGPRQAALTEPTWSTMPESHPARGVDPLGFSESDSPRAAGIGSAEPQLPTEMDRFAATAPQPHLSLMTESRMPDVAENYEPVAPELGLYQENQPEPKSKSRWFAVSPTAQGRATVPVVDAPWETKGGSELPADSQWGAPLASEGSPWGTPSGAGGPSESQWSAVSGSAATSDAPRWAVAPPTNPQRFVPPPPLSTDPRRSSAPRAEQWAGGSTNEPSRADETRFDPQQGSRSDTGQLLPGATAAGQQWPGGPAASQQWPGGANAGQPWSGGANAGQQWPGGANAGQRWDGDSNAGQQRPTGANAGQQWSGGENAGQHWAGGANAGQQRAGGAGGGRRGAVASGGGRQGVVAPEGGRQGVVAPGGGQGRVITPSSEQQRVNALQAGQQWGGGTPHAEHRWAEYSEAERSGRHRAR
ncbi:diguanylate cyclase domain-containing protein [Winogradskya humida]|uniref:PAS domain S-box-containing protein/diguanylate cyclase (GGDEF)-like protein n=1 Tax=Winogradskya humida TaxID=113566 RepID=A0ABQ3ZUG1_9ACTN|nr:diguanylate cyclase [Actinoplanes humidus]GIE22215.1 hypothetical protein Ahu01nite_053170 [Actinoplanes humidus]